jgi:hypothetical protein
MIARPPRDLVETRLIIEKCLLRRFRAKGSEPAVGQRGGIE